MCLSVRFLSSFVRKSIESRRAIVSAAAFVAAWGLSATTVLGQDEPAAAAGASGQNLLVKTWNGLGPIFAVIFLIMSVVLVALVVRGILTSLKNNFTPDDLTQGVDASLEEGNAQAAVDLVQADDSLLATVLSSGLAKLPKGREAAFEAMQVTGEAEIMKIEHMLGYLALIGNVAPMVGLLGTVQGMVVSFGQIASSEQTPKPSVLAGGIEMALYTTLVGLILAIPAIAIYNILKNKVQQHVLRVGVLAEDMIEKFEPFVGK